MSTSKILFIFENGGKSSQEFVRGELYKELFYQYNFNVKYLSYRFIQPNFLFGTSNRIAKILSALLISRLFWAVISKILSALLEFHLTSISKKYDVIIFIKVSSLSFIEKIRKRTNAMLIYDQCDALWLPHFIPAYKDIRKILPLMDAVTWDYRYTKEFVQQFNQNVHYWGAASQVELFDKVRDQYKAISTNDRVVIGWIGSESTIFNLYSIWESLETVFKSNKNLHLRILGVGMNSLLLPNFENVSFSLLSSYTPSQMVSEVLQMDIGLFPLFNVEDSRVRGYLKALIYMSGETAVIASPIGMVPELIEDGVNGLLANNTNEWIKQLQQLISNKELRQQIAKKGLETVRRDYNLEKSFKELLFAINYKSAD